MPEWFHHCGLRTIRRKHSKSPPKHLSLRLSEPDKPSALVSVLEGNQRPSENLRTRGVLAPVIQVSSCPSQGRGSVVRSKKEVSVQAKLIKPQETRNHGLGSLFLASWFRSRCLSMLKPPSKGNVPLNFLSAQRDDVMKLIINMAISPSLDRHLLDMREGSSPCCLSREPRWTQESHRWL